MELKLPECLYELADAINTPIYVVGGFLRNYFAGLKETDIDLCGSILPQAINLPLDFKVEVVNFRLGTALITHKKTGMVFEYTPFRIEKYSPDGSHTPVEINFTLNINSDCKRRDFTCNSLYYNIKTKELIDLCGAQKDIENKVIRAMSVNTFNNDGLRLLRLIRIACETGFSLHGETAKLAKANANKLSKIANDRIRVEFDKILVADTKYGIANAHFRALKLLDKLDVLQYFLYQLASCKNKKGLDFDLLERTFAICKYCPPEIRLAGLLCDIGYSFLLDKKSNLYTHDCASEIIAKDIMYRLHYSKHRIEHISSLIRWHMYDYDNKASENRLKLFVAKNINILDDLIELKKAIAKATNVEYVSRLENIRDKLIEENAPCSLAELVINGNDFVENGVDGKIIGETLNQILNECILNPKLNNIDSLMKIVKRCAYKYKKSKNLI